MRGTVIGVIFIFICAISIIKSRTTSGDKGRPVINGSAFEVSDLLRSVPGSGCHITM